MTVVLTQEREPDRVSFYADGALITAYVFGDSSAARPYWYPLIGPSGQKMTRRFPMESAAPDEPTDHPHHRSLWCGHGSVNGHDNWNEPTGHAFTRFRSLEPQTASDTLTAHADWTDNAGNLLCHETLTVRVSVAEDNTRLLDWTVILSAPDNAPVTFGDTKECGLVAVRVAAPLQTNHSGQITNAKGGVGEGECWGKASRWCDYAGPLTPETAPVGIALLSHPDSYGHPTHWHVRGYGLFAANPFGLSSFTQGAQNGAVTLAPGESLCFHYAIVLHDGKSAAEIESVWQSWARALSDCCGPINDPAHWRSVLPDAAGATR